jgi:serine/threonine protein kinase
MSPPRSITHYKILSKLGEGGMGAVYRATDTKLGRDVAIKILPEAFAQDNERMARFGREAQVLAALNHPNERGRIYANLCAPISGARRYLADINGLRQLSSLVAQWPRVVL